MLDMPITFERSHVLRISRSLILRSGQLSYRALVVVWMGVPPPENIILEVKVSCYKILTMNLIMLLLYGPIERSK